MDRVVKKTLDFGLYFSTRKEAIIQILQSAKSLRLMASGFKLVKLLLFNFNTSSSVL